MDRPFILGQKSMAAADRQTLTWQFDILKKILAVPDNESGLWLKINLDKNALYNKFTIDKPHGLKLPDRQLSTQKRRIRGFL
jgi:hypothetical protein